MKPTSPDPTKEKLENRLRYYDDLGIRAFFRDRALPASSAPARQPLEENSLASKRTPAVAAPPSIVVPSNPAGAVAATPAPATEAPKLQIVGHGPSLFESADRIAGDTLERIFSDLGECTRCKLHRHRNKIVFGVGNPQAELVFVGEGPGHDEDLKGIPFVGRAGQLLTQMIEAMGLRRDDVYIANVVKCRPPENRTPEKDEVATCMPFLFRQLASINPKAIVCLGNCAAQALLGTNKSISHFRGQWFDFRGSKLLPTYHPAYLLRNPHAKPEVWSDLKKVMAFLGLKAPAPRSKS